LNKDAPVTRQIQRTGIISSHPILSGLNNHVEVVTPGLKLPRKHRIGRVRQIADPRAFLLGVNVPINKLDGAIEASMPGRHFD
jgi:hypothetical protein